MSKNTVKVFLNHASEDKPLVRKLYHELKKEPWIHPWLDEEEILPGQDWEYEINKALDDSDAVIICLSKTSIAKIGVVQAEIHKAQELQRRRPEGHVFMIPVLLEKCVVPSRLSSLHWVDVSVPGNLSKITKSLASLMQNVQLSATALQNAPEPAGTAEPPVPRTKKPASRSGGFHIGGNVQITQGDFVAGDKNINVEKGAVFAGRDIQNSKIVTGNQNQFENRELSREAFFNELLEAIDRRQNIPPEDKEDLKANVAELQIEAEKGDEADESFLARRLRNIKRIAPDIAQVLLATLISPAAGFASIVQKVAERLSLPA